MHQGCRAHWGDARARDERRVRWVAVALLTAALLVPGCMAPTGRATPEATAPVAAVAPPIYVQAPTAPLAPVAVPVNSGFVLPDWLTALGTLLGIVVATYASRRAIDAKATAVEAREAGVATANAIVPALASVRAGAPLADVAYVLEDKGVPIDMGNPLVVAATTPPGLPLPAITTREPPKPGVAKNG
jgi:hypothetical protein